jgi:hypothetical protein
VGVTKTCTVWIPMYVCMVVNVWYTVYFSYIHTSLLNYIIRENVCMYENKISRDHTLLLNS